MKPNAHPARIGDRVLPAGSVYVRRDRLECKTLTLVLADAWEQYQAALEPPSGPAAGEGAGRGRQVRIPESLYERLAAIASREGLVQDGKPAILEAIAWAIKKVDCSH